MPDSSTGFNTKGNGSRLNLFIACRLPASTENAEQQAMGAGNAGRNEGNPVSRLDEVVEVVNHVIDEYRFNLLHGEIEVVGEIVRRAPLRRDGHVGR